MNKNNIKKYYIPPPYINSVIQYQNVGSDPNLRRLITEFYLKKSIKWIKNYKEFENSKKNLSKLESNQGTKIIYNLLRNCSKKYNINWYDMKEQSKYNVIKDYLKYELVTI
jgi:hypothetical protein